jgi:DNA helicase-2/ATP-dependent DNA helicase PcrA
MDFKARLDILNDAQKQAINHIDGPLMVIAGPGTGKTELLSMRAANILENTDTLPQNILCLTFTESGADAMRKRLKEIIGPDAYKVAIHTFHSFGSDVISRFSEYFYNNSFFQPADEVTTFEVIREILEDLGHDNPLSTTMNGEFTYLKDVIRAISGLKKSGLTSDELLAVLVDNERVLDACERQLSEIFENRISKSTIEKIRPVAFSVAEIEQHPLPSGINPLANILALSISHAYDDASSQNSTKPITAWRNKWLEKDSHGKFIFKDRKRINKLRAVSKVYYQYLLKMQENELYDFDDMILRVVHALEVFDELRFNLQEQYSYIMVDEFQDTNGAQLRILQSLTNNPASEGAPNIMIVGDDDQAVYSFQGAEISNILNFKDKYETIRKIVLKENYRSSEPIINSAREVITQGVDRLENRYQEINKTLHANHKLPATKVNLFEYTTVTAERYAITEKINKLIKDGERPGDIVILARRHAELIKMLPYLKAAQIPVNYEKRENVLENEIVLHLERLANIIQSLADGQHARADALLPELLAHPAWNIPPKKLWQLSLTAYKNRKLWMEVISEDDELRPLHDWITNLAAASFHSQLEPLLDTLIGLPAENNTETFISPLYKYYFDENDEPSSYLKFLSALSSLRSKLREYSTVSNLVLSDLLDYLELNRNMGTVITATTANDPDDQLSINVMTAHKSKGLEFKHVFIVGAADTTWGDRVKLKAQAISFPENLPLTAAGDSYDDRLRLFFVAMTRARDRLTISYSLANENNKPLDPASFLLNTSLKASPELLSNTSDTVSQLTAWYTPLTNLSTTTMKQLLSPMLSNYRLSATHLNSFIDLVSGGPETFMLNSLLHFPKSISPNAAYGTAVHKTLQRAHSHLATHNKRRPIEDLLNDFESNLSKAPLDEKQFSLFLGRGMDYLQQFLHAHYNDFSPSQKTELNFNHQDVYLGNAHLSGSLDVVDIDSINKAIKIIDYKTGKSAKTWKGNTEFEKIKLHKYRQQLMFYQLLIENSRDYNRFTITNLALQFTEPNPSNEFVNLSLSPSRQDLEEFTTLIQAVWNCITTLNFPDVSNFTASYKGILEFEDYLKSLSSK